MASRRTPHEHLDRARKALANAKARGEDPWRVAELTARYDAALEAALEAESAEGGSRRLELVEVTREGPRRQEPPMPLEWVDESTGRVRKPWAPS